ncbi:MAG TPA: DUF58 domain-containing protein [Vicinamibacterales bacterium]|jgi:uncharacterized protein (DUF58 family)
MPLRAIPGRAGIGALMTCTAAVLAALLAGVPVTAGAWFAGAAGGILALAAASDLVYSQRAWRRAEPRLVRRLPSAFAIGVKRPVQVTIANDGPLAWQCRFHDFADPSLVTEGLPASLTIPSRSAFETAYTVVPSRRGDVTFAPADVRVRSRLGLWEMLARIGSQEIRRVYPDFAQVQRYAWLAGDRRLQEIGVKTFQQRGEGTDFKELSEYRVGDAVRHIDWRATLRLGKPIVRQFQDERDQCVMLLVDCGRRMRADERQPGIGAAHFDQVLNAVMLLGYVALKQGDAVGAMTFGTPPGAERAFAPRRGVEALNALMGEVFSVQPTPTHSDYVTAAHTLLGRHRKRALVVLITNFRDEDSPELKQAINLLRSRHLVLVASLRERIVGELIAQPLVDGDAAVDVASAHMYEQGRRDAFNRLALNGLVMVDAEPDRLGVELVNRYRAMKRQGII